MNSPGGDAERRLQEDLYRLEAYRSQLNALLQQHQVLQASRGDHLRARETLEGLDRTADGAELLVPLGADAFLRGSAVPQAKVLLGIGSGVVVEIARERATELLADRSKRLDEAADQLEGQIRTLDEQVQLVSQRVESASRGASDTGRPGPDDVGGD